MLSPPDNDDPDDDTSIIAQLDGLNASVSSCSCSENESVISDANESLNTTFATDDEVDPEPIPANFLLQPNPIPGQPSSLDVLLTNRQQSSRLPLCMMLNSRSLYNKVDNFKTLLYQIGPDAVLVSETWERQRQSLDELLLSSQYKTITYCRKKLTNNRQPGGGCAIVYNDNRFIVERFDVATPENVEACWAIFTPKSQNNHTYKVKKIIVGAFYVAPNSTHKQDTIDHIIETIHFSKSLFEENIHFLLGGDFNRLNISTILDSYGALKQFVSVPTRNRAILEILLTDLHPFYHPPTTLDPLQVDSNKKGVDSDHNIIVMAPLNNNQFKLERIKKSITIRPIPESKIITFGSEIVHQKWQNVLEESDVNTKVDNFHNYLRGLLDRHFPEKEIKVSSLDKKWMSPDLKLLHRKVQREFVKHRKSKKWRKLNKAFKRLKRKAIQSLYPNFVSELKRTNPAKWYQMAKRIGAVDQMNSGETKVEVLQGLSNRVLKK